jgi:hypothetical protein
VAAHGDQRRDFFSVFPIYLVASGVRLWVGVSVCVCVWGVRTSKKSPKSRKNRFTQDPSRPHSPTKWTPSGPLSGHFDHQRLRAHCRTAAARDPGVWPSVCVCVCLGCAHLQKKVEKAEKIGLPRTPADLIPRRNGHHLGHFSATCVCVLLAGVRLCLACVCDRLYTD